MPQVACGNVKSIKRSTDFAQASGKELDTSASHNKTFTKPLTTELLSSFKRVTFTVYFGSLRYIYKYCYQTLVNKLTYLYSIQCVIEPFM